MVPPPSLTLALILYLLHVSSAWIWIILSCSPRGAFLSHVHMDLSPLQQQKKKKRKEKKNRKKKLRKYPPVCLWLLTFWSLLLLVFYSKYGGVFSVIQPLYFGGVVVVSYAHTPVQNSIRKTHNLRKNGQSGRVFRLLFHLLVFIFIDHICCLILLISDTWGNI